MKKKFTLVIMLMLAATILFGQQRPKITMITPNKIEDFFYKRKEFLRFCLENDYENTSTGRKPLYNTFMLKKVNPSPYELTMYISILRFSDPIPDSKEKLVRLQISIDKATCSDYIETFTMLLKEYFDKSEVQERNWVDGSGKEGLSTWLEYSKEGSEISFSISDYEKSRDFWFSGVSSKITD
ncbi:MAG: hypothetical protein EAS52_13180 [Parapedobacter sp.]|nr:MAG: hypothetical protein EAS52_13180 [Parapedobacter sp.]